MAEVVVTERCDQTLVEVYTCPPAGGGSGAFYTGVNDGTGARVYVSTDDEANPREHHFRTLVGVGGSTVTEVGDEIHISGGALYTGVSLGGGADVYKETDDTVDPREHKLRSLVAGANVQILENEDDITISAQGLTGTGTTPLGLASGVLNGGCGASTSFSPSAMGGLEVGDLMVWICVISTNSNSQPSLFDPSGWSVLYRASHVNNQYYGMFWYYKYADANDLLPGTVHTVTRYTGNTLSVCSSVFFFKNPHTELPFGGAVGQNSSSDSLKPMQVPVFAPVQSIITAWLNRSVSPTFVPVDPCVPFDNEQQHQFSDAAGGGIVRHYYLASRTAGSEEDENWIPGETPYASVQAVGWTNIGVNSIARSGASTQVTPSAAASRHYSEYTVNLTTGRKYSFAFCSTNGWNSGQTGAMGISYVDHLGNERGIQIRSTGFESGTDLDPLADRNSVWYNQSLNINEDGVPSTTGFVAMLWFTAQGTGTYKIRINYLTTADSWSPSGGTVRNVQGVLFREGWHAYQRVYTPNGPVFQSNVRGACPGLGWRTATGTAGGVGKMTANLAINPNWSVMPPAKIRQPTHDSAGVVDYDGLTMLDYLTSTDDFGNPVIATRPVMPYISGVLQKYYFEVTCLATSSRAFIGTDFPLRMVQDNDANGTISGYAWDVENSRITGPSGNVALNPGVTGTLAVGNILGIMIDYVNREVKFWKNNILGATVAMADGYPSTNTNQWSWYFPIWAAARCSWGQDPGRFKFNLMGPFFYSPPTGARPYDWLGATTAPVLTGIGSAGAGVSLLTGTDEAPEIKSLVAGSNVALTDNGDSVTIAALPTTVRGAAWSNSAAIVAVDAQPVNVLCPRAGTIRSYTVIGDAAGTAVIDVRKVTFAGVPAGAGDRICGTNKPSLTAAQKTQDSLLTGWTTTVNAGDILTFVLESCAVLKQLSVQLVIEEAAA